MVIHEINKALHVLNKKQILLYPTDTVWGIGCDATSELAVSKVYSVKNRSDSKSLIILVDNIEMLQKYVKNISKNVMEIIAKSTYPTTIIYKNPVGLAKM